MTVGKICFTEENFVRSLYPNLGSVPGYQENQQNRDFVTRAIYESWAWLNGQALIVMPDSANRTYRVLSRRAEQFGGYQEFLDWHETRFLNREALTHLPIDIWDDFLQRRFSNAVQSAFRHLEIEIRRVGTYPDDKIGLDLVNDAFAPGDNRGRQPGPLADPRLQVAERQGVQALFRGGMATYRNPTAHREIEFESAAEVAEIIIFANKLARMVARAETRIANQ